VRDERMIGDCRDGLLAVSLVKASRETHIPIARDTDFDARIAE